MFNEHRTDDMLAQLHEKEAREKVRTSKEAIKDFFLYKKIVGINRRVGWKMERSPSDSQGTKSPWIAKSRPWRRFRL